MTAGFHEPEIPLVEVAGKVAGTALSQYGPKASKTGVMLSLTITDTVVELAHWPAVGVKVYTVVPAVVVLIAAGFHEPAIPLLEVTGNVPGAAPTQYDPEILNKGVT